MSSSNAGESLEPIQSSLLSLVDVHLRSRSTIQGDFAGVLQPWLAARYVPRGRNRSQAEAVDCLTTVMGELGENIADHAFGSAPGRAERSVAQIMSTSGGRDSHDRFRVIVMDNGVGLPATIRRRHRDLDPLSAIHEAFGGGLKYGARGRGLARIASTLEGHPGSSFFMLTEYCRENQTSIIIAVADGQIRIGETPIPIVGTIAIGQVALPALAADQPELFLESTDGELVSVDL